METSKPRCIVCNSEFENTSGTSKERYLKRKYCSHSCSNKDTVEKRIINNLVTRQKISQKLQGKTKSQEHRNNLSKSMKSSDKAKKQQFKKGKDNPAFGRNQTGEANNNWKGGKTNSNQKLRNSPEYKVWRTTCMERDHFKCTDCGAKGYLQVHHIKPISTFPELIWVIDNGKTVCVSCHEKIHGRFIGKFKQQQ